MIMNKNIKICSSTKTQSSFIISLSSISLYVPACKLLEQKTAQKDSPKTIKKRAEKQNIYAADDL